MQIRFLRFTPVESVHYNAGESYDFPESIAQQHIDSGAAVAVSEAEFATMPRYGVHALVPPAPIRRRQTQRAR